MTDHEAKARENVPLDEVPGRVADMLLDTLDLPPGSTFCKPVVRVLLVKSFETIIAEARREGMERAANEIIDIAEDVRKAALERSLTYHDDAVRAAQEIVNGIFALRQRNRGTEKE